MDLLDLGKVSQSLRNLQPRVMTVSLEAGDCCAPGGSQKLLHQHKYEEGNPSCPSTCAPVVNFTDTKAADPDLQPLTRSTSQRFT